MSQIELKEFIRKSDIRPIRVHLADGAAYKISHPDYAFMTSGSLIVASGPGHELNAEFVVCPLQHVTRVEVLRQKAKAS